jgi:CHRD domain-containing protein
MRTVVIAALLAAVAGACTESDRGTTGPSTYTAPLQVQSAQPDGIAKNHRTHLSGDQEVFTPATPDGPTPADSNAQGQAIFTIATDSLSFDYKLIASNIENITQGHIHCGPAGTNGPIIVWLYPSPTATAALPGGAGRHDGVLAEGTIVSGTPLHVRTVPSSAACPGGVSSFADVLAKIRANNTYVNVHTSDGVLPANTGPGDFPGGEVRGQLQ